MAEPCILMDRQDQIGFITLNRPEHMNTFTPEFADLLDQALWDFERDEDIRVIVVKAAGKTFLHRDFA